MVKNAVILFLAKRYYFSTVTNGVWLSSSNAKTLFLKIEVSYVRRNNNKI